MTQVTLAALTKRYPNQSTPVLDNFSLCVASGEMLALLGPSGSGKSTLLKLIAGIERPDAGDILFDGQRILSMPPNQRGAVMMFQKAYLFPFLSVEDNIGFGLQVKRLSAETIRAEVKRMLALIGLPGIEKRKPGQLSGGEQQRVALARALVTSPRLLMLDEPLSSLDTSVRLNLQEAIRNIQRELGITTIFVTHDLGEAMAMSDRMALLLDGQVVAVDAPAVLFHRPPNIVAARFMGVSMFLRGDQVGGTGNGDCQKWYAIRPEHIRVEGEEGVDTMPEVGTLPGVVRDCVFRGEYIEYQVETAVLSVRARVPMPAPVFPLGAQVFVKFPKEHLFEVIE